jgi:LysM repeat protein
MKNFVFISLISLSATALFAQYCPPSSAKGVHTVQKGETLYGLSRVYKTTVAQLCQLNNMQETDILPICFGLNVGNAVATQSVASTGVPASYSYTPNKPKGMPYFKSNVKTHTVKKEETLDMIAEYYGYTRARLMYMNNIRNPENYYVGQLLTVNDCDGTTTTPETPTETVQQDIPQSYSNVPKPRYAPSTFKPSSSIMSGNSSPSGNPNYSWNSAYKRVIHVVSQDQMSQKETPSSIGKLHGLSAAEVIAMNNLNPNLPLVAGQRLVVEDRLGEIEASKDGFFTSSSPTTTNQPTPQYMASTGDIPSEYSNSSMRTPTISAPTPPMSATTSMNSDEMSMINEINLVRSNPAGYIFHIEKYITDLQKDGNNASAIASARELIAELYRMPAVATLQPLECVYQSAKKNGLDQLKRGTPDHQGSDGSMPWDRIIRECPSLKDGNENLLGGVSDIRTIVITLLVDDGIQSRGHRRNLLQADWRYVACHKIGTVGGMPHYWLQEFAN